jgi:hypothetical protein
MNLDKVFLAILILAFLTISSFSKEKDNKAVSALGFNFGISKKGALEIIKSQHKKVLEDTVDSKNIRTIVVEGVFLALPADVNHSGVETNLEFYDNELMASSLVFKSGDISEQAKLKDELSKFLTDLYGEPKGEEEILHLTSWTWHVTDMAVVLSVNPESKVTRVECTYKPINETRKDEEYKKLQEPERLDPASQMFKQGDYSKPTEYQP